MSEAMRSPMLVTRLICSPSALFPHPRKQEVSATHVGWWQRIVFKHQERVKIGKTEVFEQHEMRHGLSHRPTAIKEVFYNQGMGSPGEK